MENINLEYAGFWKRFAAAVIDDFIVYYFFSEVQNFIVYFAVLESGIPRREGHLMTLIFYLCLRWSYFAGMESSPLKATIGKMAVGIYVTDEKGNRIGFGKATGRFFGKILSGLTLFFGYIMAGVTPRKQALHDKMSNCLVLAK